MLCMKEITTSSTIMMKTPLNCMQQRRESEKNLSDLLRHHIVLWSMHYILSHTHDIHSFIPSFLFIWEAGKQYVNQIEEKTRPHFRMEQKMTSFFPGNRRKVSYTKKMWKVLRKSPAYIYLCIYLQYWKDTDGSQCHAMLLKKYIETLQNPNWNPVLCSCCKHAQSTREWNETGRLLIIYQT